MNTRELILMARGCQTEEDLQALASAMRRHGLDTGAPEGLHATSGSGGVMIIHAGGQSIRQWFEGDNIERRFSYCAEFSVDGFECHGGSIGQVLHHIPVGATAEAMEILQHALTVPFRGWTEDDPLATYMDSVVMINSRGHLTLLDLVQLGRNAIRLARSRGQTFTDERGEPLHADDGDLTPDQLLYIRLLGLSLRHPDGSWMRLTEITGMVREAIPTIQSPEMRLMVSRAFDLQEEI